MASPLRGGPRRIHDVGAANTGRKRETAGERLAQADEIGRDTAVFAGEPFSGAAKAGVDFVEDQERVLLVADSAQPRQEFMRRDIDNRPEPCTGSTRIAPIHSR